ncbi:transposase, partial [Wolbachia pipientis]|nr:transposase [Wolbachia pipientis]
MALSKFLDPRNDLCFKKIFGTEKNKNILIHFLNDILGFTEINAIQEVEFLSTIMDPEVASNKQSIVDVLCKDSHGNSYISTHNIRDIKTNGHYLKDFQFIFIELPKFSKSRVEELESTIERWCFFFKYAEETTEEDLQEIAEKAPIIKLAYDELDKFRWNEKDLVAYEERIMDLRKEEAILEYRLDLAEEKGKKIGKEEGKIEVAKAMLANNVDVNTIVKFTGL